MSDQLLVLGLAFLAYLAAVHYSCNGFVAAFVAGLVFGAASRRQLEQATEFTDTVGLFSSFVVWVLFGAVFVGPILRDGVHLRPVLYAVLSLTLLRMVPVAISLIGARFHTDTVLFIGWFGPQEHRLSCLHPHRTRRNQQSLHRTLTRRSHNLDDPALRDHARPQLPDPSQQPTADAGNGNPLTPPNSQPWPPPASANAACSKPKRSDGP